jgi:hypothetical protein
MRPIRRTWLKSAVAAIASSWCLMCSGCAGDYDVPITVTPTRKIDQRLLGDWALKDGEDKMKVRKLDESTYVVSYDCDLYRVFHSDVGKIAFISVQDLDSAERKFAYFAYQLSDDAKLLDLTFVKEELIPKETKDSATVQKLLEQNLQNPKLFGDVGHYVRQK